MNNRPNFTMPIIDRQTLQNDKNEYNRIFRRNADALDQFLPNAQAIFDRVQQEGNQAIIDLELQFNTALSADVYNVAVLAYTQQDIDNAYTRLKDGGLDAIVTYNSRVKTIGDAIMQKESDSVMASPYPGYTVNYIKKPFDRVGIYVPAGQVPLPIVSGMLVQSAVCAGVREIVVCIPPTNLDADIIVAANEAVKQANTSRKENNQMTLEIYRMGGAQSIAALALGTETIKPVNFIAGPGSIYVQAAKKIAQLKGCGVDAIGGPSEQMVLVEDGASDEAIMMAARDTINEAEHGPTSTGIVVTNSPTIAKKIQYCISTFAAIEPRGDVITKALQTSSAIIVTDSVQEMIDVAKKYGPEHIGLYMKNPEKYTLDVNSPSVSFNDITKNEYFMTTARANYGGAYHCTIPTGIYSGNQRGATTPDMFCKTIETLQIDNNASIFGLETMISLAQSELLPAHEGAMRTTAILNDMKGVDPQNDANNRLPDLTKAISDMQSVLSTM